jgi:hypothetical protein
VVRGGGRADARFKKRLESLEALGMEHRELEKEIETDSGSTVSMISLSAGPVKRPTTHLKFNHKTLHGLRKLRIC